MPRNRLSLLLFFVLLSSAAKSHESILHEVSGRYLEVLIATAKANYPRIKSLEQRIDIAQTNVGKTKISWFDVFSFSFLYSPHNSTTLIKPSNLNANKIGLYLNIGSVLQKPYLIKQARSELGIAKSEKEEYELNIEAQVKQRYYLYLQNLAILKLKGSSAADAESSMKQIKYRFEKGEDTFQNYNNVTMSYTDRLQSKIEAETSLMIAKSNLEELLGKKLEEIK